MNDVKMAKIAVNKSLLREYKLNNDRVVYLENGTEFQIQFFNPHDFIVAADIYLNGTRISNRLVIRPGERIWLDRYLDKSVKFRFETYEVELDNETHDLVEKAIKNNGDVKIVFYQEEQKENIQMICDSPLWNGKFSDETPMYYKTAYLNSPAWKENYCTNISTCCSDYNSNTTLLNCDITDYESNNIKLTNITADINNKSFKTKETGRVSEGNYSNQKLKTVYNNFSSFSFNTEHIKILPMSEKVYSANDLKKKYCTECGHKLSPKHKYCPNCGTKVE